jgi:hypothetical protein
LFEKSPHPGAKPCFLIEEKLDDKVWLKKLVEITIKELSETKEKRKGQIKITHKMVLRWNLVVSSEKQML